jgi:flagellar biosynthesis/type III secretory pathway ATPase
MGAYVPGSDPELDSALQCWPKIKEFLQQDSELSVGMADTLQDLLMIARA